jgi:hypothetical protein
MRDTTRPDTFLQRQMTRGPVDDLDDAARATQILGNLKM